MIMKICLKRNECKCNIQWFKSWLVEYFNGNRLRDRNGSAVRRVMILISMIVHAE